MKPVSTALGLRRLRVAYFVPPSINFAGIERVTHEIAAGLATAHPLLLDVHVIYSSAYDENLLEATPYTKHVLRCDRLRQIAGALRAVVAREDFDVLVCPQVEASVIAWAATRGLRLPALVPHLHGNPRLEQAEGTIRTKLAFHVFETVVARSVPLVLAVSPSLRDYAATSLARHTRVVYAKNPVRALGEGSRQPSADGRFRFVCVARLSRQKGQDLLLRAIALARDSLPPFLVTLVGRGTAEADLRRLSAELNLTDVVSFVGYSSDPVQRLRHADCFVLASRWEGFGVSLVEALQVGLPLLAADCDFGPSDIITDPSLGILVAPDDPAALAVGLIRAARQEWTREDVSRRYGAADEFSPTAAVASHFSILTSLNLS